MQSWSAEWAYCKNSIYIYIYLYRENKIKSYYEPSDGPPLTDPPILPFHHLHKRFLGTVIILYFISSAQNPICWRLLGGNCFRNDNGMLKLSGFPESPGLWRYETKWNKTSFSSYILYFGKIIRLNRRLEPSI